MIINSYSCFIHKVQIDQTQLFILDSNLDFQLDSSGDYCFVAPKNHRGTITFLVTQQVVANIKIFSADNVDLNVRLILLFPQAATINVSVIICGEHSNITILGMCALAQQESVSITTNQIHCGKQSSSKLILQGLIADHGILRYDGTIRIEKDAFGTYALQNNKNILLSSTATAVSIPNIEVLNHDVQCYHGTAIGKFDIEQMQYMQTRGLNEQTIQQLLVQELFAPVLQEYEKREFILQTVYEKI
ncbi:MAG: SufD family Fe-S cluster assembly protein [Candidatus Dependentiae bacterium]|nr:SufD family Fe-S cluster assembly protein [Candidatus Dependentiae bacterium]